MLVPKSGGKAKRSAHVDGLSVETILLAAAEWHRGVVRRNAPVEVVNEVGEAFLHRGRPTAECGREPWAVPSVNFCRSVAGSSS